MFTPECSIVLSDRVKMASVFHESSDPKNPPTTISRDIGKIASIRSLIARTEW
jgi:hypothetical protein